MYCLLIFKLNIFINKNYDIYQFFSTYET